MKRLSERQKDGLALLLILLLAVAFLHKVVFTRGVFLPADLLLVMNPWRHYASEQFPDFRQVQNPLLDVIQQYYPWRLFAVRTLRAGEIPLWNPHAFCGTPFVANLQSAIFYPLNLIFFLTSVGRGFGFGALLHLFLIGTSTYLLLRHWRLRRTAALLGAVTFMFNGYFVVWMEYPSISLWTGAWLPLILLLFDKAVEQRSLRWAVGAGIVVGVQFLGGHLNTSFYVVLGLTAYAAFTALSTDHRPQGYETTDPRATRPQTMWSRGHAVMWSCGLWSVICAVGFTLAAVQLLPAFELAQRSTRSVGHRYEEVVANGLPLHHLITFLAPNFFGNNKGIWWGGAVGSPLNFIETTGYVGVLPLAFALFAVCFYRRPHVWFFAGLALFCLLIAMGTPLYALLFYLVPGFKQLAAPARILYLHSFCLAVLAAFGADRLERIGAPAHRRTGAPAHTPYFRFCFLFALLSVFALAVAVLRYADFFFADELFHGEVVQLVWSVVFIGAAVLVIGCQVVRRLIAPWGMVAVGLAVTDLFMFGLSFNPVCDARILDLTPNSVERLRADRSPHRMMSFASPDDPRGFLRWMPPNTPTMFGLHDIQGSDSLVVKRYQEFLNAIQPGAPTHDFRGYNSPLINVLNVKYALTEMSLDAARWERVADDDVTVYRNRRVLPRTFLVQRVWVKHRWAEVLSAMTQPNFAPDREVLLEEEPEWGEQRGNLEVGGEKLSPSSRLITYRPNRVEVRARSTAPCVLVLADTWYAGWRVAVDGVPRKLLRADGVLRAVVLPAGRHDIVFAYHPAAFRLGAYLSLAAVAFIVAVWSCGARGVRRGG